MQFSMAVTRPSTLVNFMLYSFSSFHIQATGCARPTQPERLLFLCECNTVTYVSEACLLIDQAHDS